MIIGLPYLNPTEPEVFEQIKTLARFKGSQNDYSQFKSTFLDNQCMRIVNQAIGRAIRHSNDYASIILIDERFSKDSIQSKLPKWIQSGLDPKFTKFSENFPRISKFFREKKIY
jgi:chromosome transmission fidelity protein 1